MKTWLILIYLAISVIPSISQDSSDGKKMEAEPLLPSEAPGIPSQAPRSENQEAIKWNIQRMKLLKFHVFQGDAPENVDLKSKNISSTGNEKRTEETHPSSPHHNHTISLHSQDAATNKKEDGTGKLISTPAEKEELNKERHEEEDGGGEEEDNRFTNVNTQLSFSRDDCQKCQSATESPPRDSTTAKPLTTTEKTTPSVPPRRNPWATCDHSTPEMEGKVAAALTEFAVNFYKKATEFDKDSNIVFSPFSISVMLSNILLGACDETKVRLEKLLSYPEDIACVHAALKNLQKSEALASASAIFYQPTLTLNDEFRNLSDKFYQSRIQHLSNDSHQDVTDINAWVSKNTDHKIKKLLDDLDPDVQMVLLNAVFLRAKWKTMFRKNVIGEEFYRPGLPTIIVPMMTSKKYPVASFVDNSLQAKVGLLQLSHNLSMIIIMPLSLSQNLSEVEKRLDADVLKAVMWTLERMPFRPTIVNLPKFKVASSLDLISIVQRLDYGIFFDANLCGISEDEEIAVTSAQHRAVVEINEKGVEAAAATVISLARTANFFSVQQPFIFMVLKDNEFPVFLGRIHNPKAS
ncbi:plasma protease C1 inhibitor [Tiliqua scincoides]|uniref:plasma protease C1 inhibitor n=1 Tax=Tiliqua scincoides TaxID=71010 RepID=UPI0034635122